MLVTENVQLNDYIAVAEGDTKSFGGSQTWFPVNQSRHLRTLNTGACGLIASLDFLMYFSKKNQTFVKMQPGTFISNPDAPLSKEQYLSMVRDLSRFAFPVFPRIGAFSFELSLLINRYFRSIGRRERLHFQFLNTKKKRDDMIRKQLTAGYPVPLIIGQRLLNPFTKKGVTFYELKGGKPQAKAMNVVRHFVNITGIYLPEDASLPLYYEISSWGRKYYIEVSELDHYISRISAPWITSVYILNTVK